MNRLFFCYSGEAFPLDPKAPPSAALTNCFPLPDSSPLRKLGFRNLASHLPKCNAVARETAQTERCHGKTREEVLVEGSSKVTQSNTGLVVTSRFIFQTALTQTHTVSTALLLCTELDYKL